MRHLAILSITICLLPTSLAAQAESVQIGEKIQVRVHSPTRYAGHRLYEGTYQGSSEEHLSLLAGEVSHDFAFNDIELIERHVGTRSNGLLGVLLGGPVGVGLVLAVSGGIDSLDEVWVLPAGLLSGAAVGLVVGSAIQTDVWDTVDRSALASLPYLRIRLAVN